MSKLQPGQEEYTLGDVIDAEKRKVPHDQHIRFNVASDEPIRCSAPKCRRDIKEHESFIVIKAEERVVIWHMSCINANQSGTFDDEAYRQHLTQRLRGAGLFIP